LNTKVAANELSFLLVTHMTNSDARFDSYGILNQSEMLKNFSGQTVQTGERSSFEGRTFVKHGEGYLHIP
jgi:hypothetical protein